MNHDTLREMLARRWELTADEEAALQAHLQDCPECHQTAEVYAQQTALLRALPSVPPPPQLRRRILTSIESTPARRRRIPQPMYAAVPLAAAAVIVFGIFLGGRHHQIPRHESIARPTSAPAVTVKPAETHSRPAGPHAAHRHSRPRPSLRPTASAPASFVSPNSGVAFNSASGVVPATAALPTLDPGTPAAAPDKAAKSLSRHIPSRTAGPPRTTAPRPTAATRPPTYGGAAPSPKPPPAPVEPSPTSSPTAAPTAAPTTGPGMTAGVRPTPTPTISASTAAVVAPVPSPTTPQP